MVVDDYPGNRTIIEATGDLQVGGNKNLDSGIVVSLWFWSGCLSSIIVLKLVEVVLSEKNTENSS